MTFAFSLKGYRAMVRWFLDQGYVAVDYAAVEPERRHLVLRHDIDFSLKSAVEIGAIEKELSVRGIYFVQVRSEFYNPFTPAARVMLRSLREQGHAIGLHFDPRSSETPSQLEMKIASDAALLVSASEGSVEHVSFHRPPREYLAGSERLGGLWNAYARRFVETTGYCSDSRGSWRHGDPTSHDSVHAGRALQLLTHPIWWTGQAEYPQARLREFIAQSLVESDRQLAANCEIHEAGHAQIIFSGSSNESTVGTQTSRDEG